MFEWRFFKGGSKNRFFRATLKSYFRAMLLKHSSFTFQCFVRFGVHFCLFLRRGRWVCWIAHLLLHDQTHVVHIPLISQM